VSVYCNGCRGFGAGPIGGPFEGAVLSFEDTDSDRGCRILTIAKTMNESSVMSVKSLDTLIIFCDPKVSVSSMNNSVEPAANTVNQRRLMEKAAMSCEKTETGDKGALPGDLRVEVVSASLNGGRSAQRNY
jgi:hypothetical protein